MVKSLRRKFVIVTTLLMAALFTILWLVGEAYQSYWFDREMRSVIDVLTDSGIFAEGAGIDKELLVGGFTDEEPIACVTVDETGKILGSQVVGASEKEAGIDESTVQKMLEAKDSKYKTGGYIFTKRALNDGNTLIVAIKTGAQEYSVHRSVGQVFLIVMGLLLLIAVTFYLSKYVTLPAKEALEREKQFIADASHELKTPLGAISINAQALEIKQTNAVYINNILSETGRMNRLIEKLLMLSKLEESDRIEKTAFSLSDVVCEMVLTYESIAFEKGKTVEADIGDDIMFYGNEDEIRQLMAILLDNAIKNSEENGHIVICCRNDSGHNKITVANNGKGIKKEDLAHIFERFYTTDQARQKGSFGLGLAIAKEIVTRHGGTIEATSVPGEETVFTVIF